MVCEDAPAAIREAGVDALLVDQMEPAGGAVAEHLGLPFITVCNALAINRDPVAPPSFTPWAYRETSWARMRNAVGYQVSDWLTRPISNAVAEYRRRWKMPRLASPDESFSKLAQICQMPREFDFPRQQLPACFHYVGPLRRTLPTPVAFPWERLDGRPLVYASLGTLQNSREPLFRCFAEACRGLDVQLVISHGGGLSEREASNLPGEPLVVSYAPQVDVLARAHLTITHAGLNTGPRFAGPRCAHGRGAHHLRTASDCQARGVDGDGVHVTLRKAQRWSTEESHPVLHFKGRVTGRRQAACVRRSDKLGASDERPTLSNWL